MTSVRIRRRARRAVYFLAATGLLLAACSTPTTDQHAAVPDPGTGHLHGLGVDPADGAVYAAGHHGVFRLERGTATRVADRYQDTMGFTITGPSTFLASGHPAPADPDARSPHLGLIRSTDAGRTWQTLSAEGEADFHALQQAGDTLYGFDSQSEKVWASTDGGRTWDIRAGLPLLDLAAHADSPATVWAATGEGLVHSSDGARSFRAVPGAPALVAVDEPEPGLLVALAADGRLITSRGGQTWTEQGRLPAGGEPAVLTAATARHLLAADSTDTVYQSTDGGRTWTALHRPYHQAEHPQES
ncbi:exo-alpha-sialidase [Streptomyces sp. SID9913]|uniref:Exo-alpha-sialidase n=2 Tax=unclassified Streptomyces TaxID=2593676 RepID=A0A6G3QUD9_9ACTN|nr:MULTISPECIES: exo-alpha-sialidase [unclassified Streptomyces]NEA87113.1 exo-alpha-sialidase [Streptomyces sp. SID14436]NEC80147.1 exo-alpha-sialidase [Streptomyces sp. SID7958]NED20825.1 exo-alpha-sialidase [Streptomyces sp. SID9913]